MVKAVILAGGLGTRITEETQYIPKPMIEIGLLGDDLSGQNFRGASLSGKNLVGKDLSGADLSNAILIGTNFEKNHVGTFGEAG
jgi:uncharacterized protein YjbI with pentapeptide repeats